MFDSWVYREGVIEEPRDLLIAITAIAGVLAVVLITLSPAIAFYKVAVHVGMGSGDALWVGMGGYVLTLLYIRFGGVNVNIGGS